MRISDVVQTCALPISRDSGLGTRDSEKALTFARTVKLAVRRMGRAQRNPSKAEHRTLPHNAPRFQACGRPSFKAKRSPACGRRGPFHGGKGPKTPRAGRSEEPPYELHFHMRTSYAAFY